MFLKKHWIFLTVLIVVICGVSVYLLHINTPKEPIVIIKPVEVEKPPAEAPVRETEQDGHIHEDGTWHEGAHDAHAPPAVPGTAPPGVATTPDFPPVDPNDDPVEAAYKRLEYIKNNPYAWGGVHSERATELIAQLMPPPVLVDEDHGEEVTTLVRELIAENDPRAAEVLISNICDGSFGSRYAEDALVKIGPPAVPYTLLFLSEEYVRAGTAAEVLARIAIEYPGDLGDIIDHIIIPKLEAILMSEGSDPGAKYFTREALAKLRQ